MKKVTLFIIMLIIACEGLQAQQKVKVQNGAKLILDAAGEVFIGSDFEVDSGSEFEIKYP